MKVLIIYSTRGGVSRTCAQMLRDYLGGTFDVTLCDIEDGAPSPDGFDVAVVGGSIRMGKLNKKLKAYIKANLDTLNQIHTAAFLCCGLTENFDDYVSFQIPKNLLPKLGIHCFGGELKPQKLKGLDKLIVKSVRASIVGEDFESSDPSASPLPEIVPENIRRLADSIRNLL